MKNNSMVKWKAKSCARCGGTTYLEKDGNDTYEKCLMCSHTVQIKPKLKVTEKETAASTN